MQRICTQLGTQNVYSDNINNNSNVSDNINNNNVIEEPQDEVEREDGEVDDDESDSELSEYEKLRQSNIQEQKRHWDEMMAAKEDASANVPSPKPKPKKQKQVTSDYNFRKNPPRNHKYAE